ncbi:GNAT family N-acetyltransferase [Methanococcoides alaskense]|uniref:Ribosomal protein S18 acetylase RimI-like enzyme n=1 Tax=Methanococcoides alaskense TaxID=325778 RepID=A0AA90TZH2_9EURY|nr:GNAT family N-acetyltransferase [Methanococcoides alaskense]MDA0524840.1 GNAT family N-acetyltransferase [Methanococcoides alaskense]MDR6223036.1 ribosomal protein S18 acetylase RimI-like enzyme [Methanococcoides alaskense]
MAIKSYLNAMCDSFIPPLDQVVDINKYSDKLVQNADCFFIQNNGKTIGFLAVYANDYSKKIAFISSISIMPEYQSTGISQKLIDFSIEYSRKKGMNFMKLEVNKNNTKAIKFYIKNLFKIESVNHNNIIMVKNI